LKKGGKGGGRKNAIAALRIYIQKCDLAKGQVVETKKKSSSGGGRGGKKRSKSFYLEVTECFLLLKTICSEGKEVLKRRGGKGGTVTSVPISTTLPSKHPKPSPTRGKVGGESKGEEGKGNPRRLTTFVLTRAEVYVPIRVRKEGGKGATKGKRRKKGGGGEGREGMRKFEQLSDLLAQSRPMKRRRRWGEGGVPPP